MTRRLQPLLLCLLLGVGCASAADQDAPTPYPDAKNEAAWPGAGPIRLFDWMAQNRAGFWKRRAADQGAIVFVGDSLTGNWKPADFTAAFPGMKVANRGIGGDVTRGVLFRLDEDVVALKPAAMVLCIGTNDLSCHAPTAGIMANISAIIDQARKADPKLPIVLCTIPPRDVANAPTKPGAHKDINERIAAYAKRRPDLVLLDLFTVLSSGPDGAMSPEDFAKDRIHLAGPGYAKWAAALRPILATLAPRTTAP